MYCNNFFYVNPIVVVLVYFSIPRINRCTCAYFYQVLLCNPKIPDSMEEVNFSSLNTFEKNFPPKFWSISISILTWKNNHEGRTVSLAVKNKNGYHKGLLKKDSHRKSIQYLSESLGEKSYFNLVLFGFQSLQQILLNRR